jgi:hypothetical protein
MKSDKRFATEFQPPPLRWQIILDSGLIVDKLAALTAILAALGMGGYIASIWPSSWLWLLVAAGTLFILIALFVFVVLPIVVDDIEED